MDEEVRKKYESYMKEVPKGSNYDIPKMACFVRLDPNQEITDTQINKLKNSIVQVSGESNIYAFDNRKTMKMTQNNMIFLYIASSFVTVILSIFTVF